VLQADTQTTTTTTHKSKPPKSPERLKNNGIFIRLSQREKGALQRAANKQDRTIADWARLAFRKELREQGFLAESEEFKVAKVFFEAGTDEEPKG
jgi:hypothetical protein